MCRASREKKRLIQNVSYHREKKKKDSQTFPALNIFVLLHFVIYEDTCSKKVKIKKIEKVIVFKIKLFF